MSTRQRAIILVGLAAEVALCLYPPMRFSTMLGEYVAGRTEHKLLFSDVGPAWQIDTGRFLVLATLIAVLSLIAWALTGLIGRKERVASTLGTPNAGG